MKKIINPCFCKTGRLNSRAFVKIEYKNEVLTMSGVIGPRSSGNCYGSCGQIYEEIRKGTPVKGWNNKMINKLCDIWDEWHLNDMRPYCAHQKQLGWDIIASEKVVLYNYCLTNEALRKQKEAEKIALAALREGRTFTPTKEQTEYAAMPYSIKTHKKLTGEMAERYEPKKSLFLGDNGATEIKILGHLTQKEHPEGILSKPCPVCGYKYGSAWIKEEVPKDIIDWLFNLPDTEVEPAWI